MLTSRQLIEEGIITHVPEECIAQVGIDLQVEYFSKIVGTGFIPKTGKTILPKYERLEWEEDNTIMLQPGSYEVVFVQGCNFPEDVAGTIIHRSSLLRSGDLLMSAEFDPGFATDHIGSFMTVITPIRIEKGARLGQMVCHRTEQRADLYQGQWQGDIQRLNQVTAKA